MPPVEASMMSRSQSETFTVGFRKNLITGTTTKLDSVFPIYDHVCQKMNFPVIMTLLFSIYFIAQLCVVSLWPQAKFWHDPLSNNGTYSFINWLSQIFLLVPLEPDKSYLTIIFLVLVISYFLCAFFLLGCTQYFRKNFRFAEWTMYPIRFIFEYAAMLLLLPCSSVCGASLIHLISDDDSIYWAFFVLSAVTTIGCGVFLAIGHSLKASSIYLNVNIISTYEAAPLVQCAIISAVIVFLQRAFTIFPDWCILVIQIVHILLMAFLVFQTRHFPFHFKYSNAIFMSLFISSGVSDVVLLIFDISGISTKFYIPIIILICLFVILAVVLYFVIGKVINNISSLLKSIDEGTDSELQELFSNMGLSNEKKAIQALRIAFSEMSIRFFDFSLLRYITSNHPSTYSMCSTLQLISFFPGESRKMNSIFSALCQRRDLKFVNRFLIYEVYRINTLRQSSVSSAANEKLVELRNYTNQCETLVRSFFMCKEPSIVNFEQISYQNMKVGALWEEGIRDYPNNSKFYEDYSHFLIECPADFSSAILQKHRADMIDAGHNFAKDFCFMSMISCYPDFIKKGLIDVRGNIKASANRKGSQTSNSSSREMSSTAFNEIDQEIEDTMGKQLLRQSKMRLALHHSIKNRVLSPTKFIPYSISVLLIVFFACFLVIYFYLESSFVERKTSMDRLSYISKVRFYMALSDDCIFMRFINLTDRLSIDKLKDLSIGENNLNPYMSMDYDFGIAIMMYMNQCRLYYSLLLDDISDLGAAGYSVYEMAAPLFSNLVNVTICYNGNYLEPQPSNLKNVIVLALFSMAQMSSHSDLVTWYNSSVYCEVIKNWDMTMVGSGKVFSTLTADQNKRFYNLQMVLKIMMISFPIGLFIISFVPTFVSSMIFIKQMENIARVIIKMDSTVKLESMKQIRPNTVEDLSTAEITEMKKTVPKIAIVLIIFLFLCIATSLFGFIMVYYSNITNENINKLNMWQYYCCNRLSLSCECFHMIITAPVLNETIYIEFMSQQSEVDLGTDWMNQLDQMNEGLLQGDGDSPPCFGYDTELDKLNLQEACVLGHNDTSIHDTYRCSSANQGIAAFRDFVVEICREPNAFHGRIGDDTTLNFLHLANSHLWRRLEDCINRILDLAVIAYDDMVNTELIFLICSFILAVITFIVGFYIYQIMLIETKGALSIIKRVHPLDIVNNKALIDILLNRDSDQKEHEMSVDQSIIHNSFDSIVCTSVTGVIEIVNQSVSNLLGYTPEQLLGQQPTTLFTADQGEQIAKQMKLMLEKQSPPVYEEHMICVSDATIETPCHTTILAMDNSNGDVNSFVFIIRDESALVKQQKIAEEAKVQSENLLFQILPRDIVVKLNRGEKDISFTVPSASIIFIDIVKFSEYSASLTPQEIMGNLSLVFASFDSIIKKYNLITKIKLIGDIYMAATGLFFPDERPQAHAEQTVRFGLDSIQELEDVNVRLNANLNIRVGVNSGGPVLAGVLGTDKPVFDIIGDPINVAARLQTTCVPGRVQIPQSTFDLIQEFEFFTEQRGEVFLKGKGQTMTYLVMPSSQFANFRSSSEEVSNKKTSEDM